MAPVSANTATPRSWERGSLRTFRLGCVPCTAANSAPPPVPTSKDCLPPELSLRPADERMPALSDSRDREIQSTRGETPEINSVAQSATSSISPAKHPPVHAPPH